MLSALLISEVAEEIHVFNRIINYNIFLLTARAQKIIIDIFNEMNYIPRLNFSLNMCDKPYGF